MPTKRFRTQRYNSDCTQVLDADGKVVALLERFADDMWAVFQGDQRISKRRFTNCRQRARLV